MGINLSLFRGLSLKHFSYKTWTINDVTDFVGSWHDPDWGDITPLCDQFPTIIFKPNPRAPASVEARVVLQLQDDPADYEGQYGVVLAEARRELDDEQSEQDEQDEQIMMPDEPIPLGYSFFLRRQCCFCPDLIQAVADVAQCDCLAELFFNAFDWHVKEDCLADGYHLVRIDDKLKPLKIPSIALDMDNLELSFNWLSLCQSFYLDELKLRRIARPWMRYLSVDHSSGRLMVHWQGSLHYPGFFEGFTKRDLLQACKEDGWIFWDRRLNYESLFHPLECKE